VDEVTGILFPLAAQVVFTEPANPRSIRAAQLAEMAGHHAAGYSVIPSAEDALESVLLKAQPEDAIFVTGSLYLVGELRRSLRQRRKVATG
jgi:dihydrofolate synthase/folylpolyglutamate synthase